MSTASQALPIQAPFVGRKREQQAYQQLLTKATPWALVVTGQGGNGKSTLLRYLAEQTPQDIPVVTLNFANESLRTDPLKILEELSWKLAAYCDAQRVDTFEKTLEEGRTRNSELGRQMGQTIDAATLSEQRRQVRGTVARALYAQLLTFQPARLVIMLDTYEWLTEPEGLELGRWVMDELIPGIHDRMVQSRHQCSVVVASRMQPPMTVIEQQDRYTLALPMLEKESVDLYLQQVGMQDSALRERVYDITHGHPLCVSIIGTLWQERGDHAFTLADLPQLQAQFSERALLEFIQERLDKRLKTPFRELTHYGVLLRSFNLPMLRAIFPELLPESEALELFRQLVRYPYVEPQGNQSYAIHELLREIQAAEIREQEPQAWSSYHKRVLDYLTQTAPHSADWYYHAIAYDEEEGMADWWKAVQEPQNYGTAYLGSLFQAANDPTLKLSPARAADLAFLLGRFYYSGSDLQLDTALECYKVALPLYQQVPDRLGEANVRKAIGDVQQFRKDLDTALQSYGQALTLYQQVGDRLGEANVRQAMGEVQQLRKDTDTALQSYEQALALYQQVGDRLGEANVRKAIGDVQQFRRDLDTALQSYEQALALYRQVGDRLGEANVRHAIGDVQQARENMDAALQSYEQAMTLYQQVDSKLGQANCYLEQGRIAFQQQAYRKALDLYNNAYPLYQQIQASYSQARLLYFRSFVHESMQDQQHAIQDVQEALSLAQSLNIPEVALLQERLDELGRQ